MDQEATFDEARKICAKDFPGARVLAIKSQETADFFKKFTEEHKQKLWLGASRQRNGFKWVDGFGNYEDLTFENWNHGEPNDKDGKEGCVILK